MSIRSSLLIRLATIMPHMGFEGFAGAMDSGLWPSWDSLHPWDSAPWRLVGLGGKDGRSAATHERPTGRASNQRNESNECAKTASLEDVAHAEKGAQFAAAAYAGADGHGAEDGVDDRSDVDVGLDIHAVEVVECGTV